LSVLIGSAFGYVYYAWVIVGQIDPTSRIEKLAGKQFGQGAQLLECGEAPFSPRSWSITHLYFQENQNENESINRT
jgi:hypothetical protein